MSLNHDEPPPAILYKYRRVNKDSLKLLQDGKLYLSDPVDDFNDPFDCQLPFDYRATKSDVLEYLTKAAARQNVYSASSAEVEELAAWIAANATSDSPEWRQQEAELTEMLLTASHRDGQRHRIGVCSLSEIRDDILMFTHYADGHKGFCIGIDTTRNRQFFYNNNGRYLRNIDYLDDYNPPRFFGGEDIDRIIWKLYTKSFRWSYEQEWRLVDYMNGCGVTSLPKANISEVILGCRMPSGDRDRIRDIVAKSRPRPTVYQAKKARGQIALELVEEHF